MSTKTIKVSSIELQVLKIICYAEYAKIKDRQEHAHSHGDTSYSDSHIGPLTNIIQELDAA